MTDADAIHARLGEVVRLLLGIDRRLLVLEQRQLAPVEWLTSEEATAAFRVSRSWLYRSTVRRRKVGRRTLWHRAGLEDVVRGAA